jgi:hypothetical protein
MLDAKFACSEDSFAVEFTELCGHSIRTLGTPPCALILLTIDGEESPPCALARLTIDFKEESSKKEGYFAPHSSCESRAILSATLPAIINNVHEVSWAPVLKSRDTR